MKISTKSAKVRAKVKEECRNATFAMGMGILLGTARTRAAIKAKAEVKETGRWGKDTQQHTKDTKRGTPKEEDTRATRDTPQLIRGTKREALKEEDTKAIKEVKEGMCQYPKGYATNAAKRGTLRLTALRPPTR